MDMLIAYLTPFVVGMMVLVKAFQLGTEAAKQASQPACTAGGGGPVVGPSRRSQTARGDMRQTQPQTRHEADGIPFRGGSQSETRPKEMAEDFPPPPPPEPEVPAADGKPSYLGFASGMEQGSVDDMASTEPSIELETRADIDRAAVPGSVLGNFEPAFCRRNPSVLSRVRLEEKEIRLDESELDADWDKPAVLRQYPAYDAWAADARRVESVRCAAEDDAALLAYLETEYGDDVMLDILDEQQMDLPLIH